MFIHIALLLYCVYLSIKQLFPLYMCICSLACCPSRALDWLINIIIILWSFCVQCFNVRCTNVVVFCNLCVSLEIYVAQVPIDPLRILILICINTITALVRSERVSMSSLVYIHKYFKVVFPI